MSGFDKFLAAGSAFDWITPLCSLVRTSTSEHQTYSTPDYYIEHVRAAAAACGVEMHSESLSPEGDLFLFDVTPDEWRQMADWLGW